MTADMFPRTRLAAGRDRSVVRMTPARTTKLIPAPTRLRERRTAVEDVYVIGHFGIAEVDDREWSLEVAGLVRHPFRIGLAELRALPSVTLTAVLECFGNPLAPDVPTRRVANVTWRGVPVRTLLDRAQPGPAARLLCAEGLDHGTFDGTECAQYLKDLPLDVVADRTIVAYEMDGRPLNHQHGYPARLFTPGYFGTNQVKWLRSLTVAAQRPQHLFTTRLYQRPRPGAAQPVPVRDLDVNAVITGPGERDRLVTGEVAVTGWAWSVPPVVRVQVGVDEEWGEAAVDPRPAGESTWQRFSVRCRLAPGPHTIAARATDADGRSQPDGGARNEVHRVQVTASP